jgi:hypothetical protein
MSFLGGGNKSTGSGGVGPAGRTTSGKHGSKRDAKKTAKRNEPGVVEKIVSASPTLQLIKGIGTKLAKSAKEHNLARRKKHITKYNTNVPSSERIDMTDEMLSSTEGLNILRKKTKYTTAGDLAGGGDGGEKEILKPILGSDIQKTAVNKAPDGPTISELAQLEETEAQRLAKIKRRGRKATKLSSINEDIYLSKKTLLG